MKIGVRAKLFFISLGLIAISVVTADTHLTAVLEKRLTQRIREDLLVRLLLIEREASSIRSSLDDRNAWDALAGDLGRRAQVRVTLIRLDGMVLGDSEMDGPGLRNVESHSDRPEVREALAHGRGVATRYSTTLRQEMMYVAVPFSRGNAVAGVARVAMPLTEVDQAISQLRHLLIAASLLALTVAVLMSSVTAHWSSRTVGTLTDAARRMATGDLAVRTRIGGGDEIAQLGRALDQLAANLSATLHALRAERDLLAGILEGMQEGVLVLDPRDRLALVNPALRAMLLLSVEAIGKPLLEVARNSELSAVLERARSSTAPVSAEIEIGGLKPRRLLIHAAALSGEPGRLLAVCVDVTEIRRLESVRKDFVANVSHELRTPVTAVRSAAETLRAAVERDPAAAARFIDMIERNTERLQRLVEDLLDLSRIESREFQLDLHPLEVGSMISHVLSLFRERAEKKKIRLQMAVPADLPLGKADRRVLEQVLANLVDNAVKYSPEGADVSVRATANGTMIRVSVEDTGPGIEAKHLPRLFERFYRVDAGRSRELGGTGLGLAIVKHLVEAMGGAVAVESTPEKGSTFFFTLPQA